MPTKFPAAMPDQLLCKEHLRKQLERNKLKWMSQREKALSSSDIWSVADQVPPPEPTGSLPSCPPDIYVPSSSGRSETPEGVQQRSCDVLEDRDSIRDATKIVSEMGFERNSILKALALADGCPDRAVDLLLNGAIGGNDAEQPLSDFLSPRRKAPDGHYQRATECGAVPPSQRRRQKHSFRGAADDHLQATPAQMAARAAIARQAASAEPGSVSTTETSQDAATASDILAEQRELLSPGEDGELEEINNFLAALELQQEDLDSL